MPDNKVTTADGFEQTYQSNFLMAFYCTLALLDYFSPDARILQGSSIGLYVSFPLRPGNGNSNDLLDKYQEGQSLFGLTAFQIYARSKASQAIFTMELQRRLARSDKYKGIFVAAAHPGPCLSLILRRPAFELETS